MTTRTLGNFKTLREILDFNDRLNQNEIETQINELNERVDVMNPNNHFLRGYSIKKTSITSVLDWNAVYSNDKLFSCIMVLLITVVSQLVFSYISFALVNVQQNMVLFYCCQGLNLIFSYLIPLTLIQDIEEVFENPTVQLASEIHIYKQLRFCSYVHFLCFVVSLCTLVYLFRNGPFIEMRVNIRDMVETPIDMTTFIRILQLISFQLTSINLILSLLNLFLTSRKIRHCYNKIERLQNPQDMDLMFNASLVENRFSNDLF